MKIAKWSGQMARLGVISFRLLEICFSLIEYSFLKTRDISMQGSYRSAKDNRDRSMVQSVRDAWKTHVIGPKATVCLGWPLRLCMHCVNTDYPPTARLRRALVVLGRILRVAGG